MFLTGLLWLVAVSVVSNRLAETLSAQFALAAWEPLLHAAFYTALILMGFVALRWTITRVHALRSTNELPDRPTAGREWLVGSAFGWALALAVVVLLFVFRTVQPNFWITPRSIGLTALSLITLAVWTLGLEAAFRGYLYRQMIDATGPVAATIVLSLFYALSMNFAVPSASILSFLTTFVLGVLFSVAYQRTHAIWLGWGLHFAWAAALGVLFGLPLAGDGVLSAFVTTDLSGHPAIAGGGFGPEGSLLTLILTLASLPILYRVTRDFAWEYTAPEIIAAGYAMEAQPPAAHVAMEQNARPAATPLVQILGATPTAPSTMAAVNEHLREDDEP